MSRPVGQDSARVWPMRLAAAKFGPKPAALHVEADEAQRQAIAGAYGCLAVRRLEADLKINRRGDELRVAGRLHADVVQACVVSLEPVEAAIREDVSLSFAPPVQRRDAREEEAEDIAFESEDPPEPLIDGEADLGAVLLEFFALALDPYPRKPGAEMPAVAASETQHPFAALKGLKRDG